MQYLHFNTAMYVRLYSTRRCLCFALAITSNASEMYICNAIDSTYITFLVGEKLFGMLPTQIYCVVCPNATTNAWWNIGLRVDLYPVTARCSHL